MSIAVDIVAEVERRVANELPARLLDKVTFHHSRRHRLWMYCCCDHCNLRKQVTIQIMHLPNSYLNLRKILGYATSDDYRYYRQARFRSAGKAARKLLDQELERVIT